MTRRLEYFGKSPTGVEVTLTFDLDGEQPAPAVATYFAAIDAELKKAGFTRSDRLDKPPVVYGGGGGRPGAPRPETPPPDDLVVPDHCGAPMLYKPEKPAADGKKAVNPRWECRKGRDCAEAEERGGNRYPFTNWHMTKKPAVPAEADTSPPAAPATASSPAGALPGPAGKAAWESFRAKARDLGYEEQHFAEMGGRTPLKEGETTRAQLAAVLDRMKRVPRKRT